MVHHGQRPSPHGIVGLAEVAFSTWIWTKPGEDLDAIRLAGASRAEPPTAKTKTSSRPGPTNGANSGKLSRSEISEALRELKALHDDGILTDDEYETKRQGLINQL